MKFNGRKTNFLKAAILLAATFAFAVSCFKTGNPASNVKLTITGIDSVPANIEGVSTKKYGRFSHTVAEHKEIKCDSCHQRTDNSPTPKFAGHTSCVDCHFGEFVGAESNICTICHTSSADKPDELRAFPANFDEGFNMMFDHAAHSKGEALPKEGCAACHEPSENGISQSIPLGINTHSSCFTCHTPESNIGSCNTCHNIAPYKRSQAAASDVLKYAFSHADHTRKQGVGCNECHRAIANTVKSKQITFPVADQHFSSGNKKSVTCASCHNDKRAFGEKDFVNCKKCHEASGFSILHDRTSRKL